MIAWYRQLDNAQTPLEVVAVTRDYIASWTPHELAFLPVDCRPGKIRDRSDIEFLHDKLVDEYRDSKATGEALTRLQELTSFIVRATIRSAELTEDASTGGSGSAARGPLKSAGSREG